MITATDYRQTAADEWLWALEQARTPRLRSIMDWAEQEVIVPDGPFKDLSYRLKRIPWNRLLLQEIASRRWRRYVVVGCVQSGKTFTSLVLPVIYHLHEIGETVIVGIPSEDMAAEKWLVDFQPVFEASPRLRELLPNRGGGSRGGQATTIRFTNGSVLRFMTGFGKDHKRSGSTSRVIAITEVDKLDTVGERSEETTKVNQILARSASYDDQAVAYLECTVSTTEGRIWREYTGGTESRILKRCPHCHAWVAPEREHLVGWREAHSSAEARRQSVFICPSCTVILTDDDRREMLASSRLVHRDQSIDESGQVIGPEPESDVLGFRYSAFDNPFCKPGTIGELEWQASHVTDPDAHEKMLLQFYWSLPWEVDPEQTIADLTVSQIITRQRNFSRGHIPDDAHFVTVGIDIGKFLLHWAAIAWSDGATGHVIDYDAVGVPSDHMAAEAAIRATLAELIEQIGQGFNGTQPAVMLVDSRWATDHIYDVCRGFTGAGKIGEMIVRPCAGFATSQRGREPIDLQSRANRRLVHQGHHYHIAAIPRARINLLEFDDGFWKLWLRHRWTCPAEASGAMTLYARPPHEHQQLARHLLAERPREEIRPGRGPVIVFDEIHRSNHLLDALKMASIAGHLAGARLESDAATTSTAATTSAEPIRPLLTPDGLPYFVGDRTE
jgi:phage terminase large subunit GpA-like protein